MYIERNIEGDGIDKYRYIYIYIYIYRGDIEKYSEIEIKREMGRS